ncbi:rab proteins geranylgeranyltransferase component A-like [Hibiscus syriacus]|uniref:Rab proteins geranylgeranyltransferase component A-like n=1 Tax=Hibiscus syriacus TaxID=106335 RepID=A0A6A2YC74_HIBSY|nr:rab proteins geranylgeranyltransferase component A-like [Hibiscus syriacus]
MAFMGDAIEMWLNLLSSNGGPSHLLLNLATGKIERPKRPSATFTSSIGNADIRTELDQSIKAGDAKYKAALSVMASKISYENEAFVESIVTQLWKMKFVKFYNFWNDYRERDSTQAFILQDTQANPNLFVVAFRGTSPFDADDWRTDADISWCKLEAMAIMFPSVLMLHEEKWLLDRLDGVYTFGQPRVGDEKFGEYMKENMRKFDVKYFRYVYCNDMVPRVPYDDKNTLFKHFGSCPFFNSFYVGKVRQKYDFRHL